MSTASEKGPVPVITIDGPTASGKGTIAQRVARVLGWHILDSGALYRLTALAAREQNVDHHDAAAVAQVAAGLNVVFDDAGRILMGGRDVSQIIREESVGNLASGIAALLPVREALLARQRAFCRWPGLVADGRDMGTVVFPQAALKIFLVADPVARAHRRYKQLSDKGISANLSDLARDMQARDARDQARVNAPLIAAADAYTVDSSELSIEETVNKVLGLWSRLKAPEPRV